MTIPLIANVPNRNQDQTTFSNNADAVFPQLNATVAAINAMGTALNLATTTTSTTSNSISPGSKTFTVASGLGFVVGMSLSTASHGSGTNNMAGTVTSYSGTSLIVNVSAINGSGTFTDWDIALAASGSGAGLGTNTFTGAQNFAQGADIASAATINLTNATGNIVNVTGTTAISAVTLGAGMTRLVRFTGACPLTYNATTHNLNTGGASVTLDAGDMVFYQNLSGVVYGLIIKISGAPVISSTAVEKRQTVPFGPLTAAGQPDLFTQAQVGATLATGVVTNGTWMATVGNGFNADGSQRNINKVRTTPLSFPNLTASSTNYLLYNPLNDTGSFVTLVDIFQAGGTISTVNNQLTYDYLNHIMYSGNGGGFGQVNLLVIAEVDTNATVVTAIRVRAYGGRYRSVLTAIPALGVKTSFNVNFGTRAYNLRGFLRCKTAEGGASIGDILPIAGNANASSVFVNPVGINTGNVAYISSGNGSAVGFIIQNQTTGAGFVITAANWDMFLNADRDF